MAQDRDTLGTHERREIDRAQLENSFAELHKTIDRLHALQVEYRELVESVRKNLHDVQALQGEINTAVRSDEQSRAH